MAWAAVLASARDIAASGAFGALAGAAPFADVNTIFSRELRAYPAPMPPYTGRPPQET